MKNERCDCGDNPNGPLRRVVDCADHRKQYFAERAEELRTLSRKLRLTPLSLKDVIPAMQRAADALDEAK